MWKVTPHACATRFTDGCEGEVEGSGGGRPAAGGECRSAGRRPCPAESLLWDVHSRGAGTRRRERGERGRPREPRASCFPPHPLVSEGAARGAGCGRRRCDPSPWGPRPQAYATVTVKPSSPARLLKIGAVVLSSVAVLLLFGAIGAISFWKGSDNHVSPRRVLREERCAEPEAGGVAKSSLPPASFPLGGAGAPAHRGRPRLRAARRAPAPPFLSRVPGHLLPLPSNSAARLCAQRKLCRKASQGFKGQY